MIAVRPLCGADLPMLADWFAAPHVRAWWGPPEEELDAVRADLERRPGASGFDMWIAEADGAPFGYLQDGPAERAEEPYYAGLEPGARAMDLLIGPPSRLRRGLAAPMVRRHAETLIGQGAPAVYLDPAAANGPALRAYARAGFAEAARHRGGGEETIVMRFGTD